MTATNATTTFTIALLCVSLAYTRPIYFHLFRTGGRLYGSDRGGGVRRLIILFGAMLVSFAAIWLSLLVFSMIRIRSLTRLWITITVWGCLSLGFLGAACIVSWRVREWLAKRGLSLRAFAVFTLFCALLAAASISDATLLGHRAILWLVTLYLAFGVCVRLANRVALTPVTEGPGKPSPGRSSGRRVAIIVFDELDRRLLFEDRLKNLKLPAIDDFMARALTLENAIPPSRCTEISIPALLTGKMVFETIPTGPHTLTVQLTAKGPHTSFASERTIFHDAVERGYRVGCNVGYHPLDRIFPGLFSAFGWQEAPETELGVGGGWLRSIRQQIRSVFETPSFSLFADTLYARHSVSRYQRGVHTAKSILADNTIDLAFLHLSVPHPPFIFNRATGQVTARHARKRSYFDNLALVDQTLATLMETVRSSGKMREFVIILTSDHWWRHAANKDMRVPFGIWFGNDEGRKISYEPRRNTIFTKDLALELLSENLASASDIVGWLDRFATDHPPTKS